MYSQLVPIPTLRTSNSGIALRKIRIPTSPDKLRIPTLHRTIPEYCTDSQVDLFHHLENVLPGSSFLKKKNAFVFVGFFFFFFFFF